MHLHTVELGRAGGAVIDIYLYAIFCLFASRLHSINWQFKDFYLSLLYETYSWYQSCPLDSKSN